MVTFSHQAKQELKPFFRAAARGDGTLEISIYEEIGQDWFGLGLTAATVKEQLEESGPGYSRVLVCINSPGGDAFEGIAIYNVLKNCGKQVDVRVDGIAASAASIIAMAGDSIVMGPNTMMMIHNAWGFCVGDSTDMAKMSGALEKISESIAQTYVSRTGKSLNDVQTMMDAETWMTAAECMEDGFCTEVSKDEPADALALAKKFKALSKLKKVPRQLRADGGAFCKCDCVGCAADRCSDCSNQNCTDTACMDCPMQKSASSRVNPPTAEVDVCVCACGSCQDGDCDECSNIDCEDPNCEGCPNQIQLSSKVRVNRAQLAAKGYTAKEPTQKLEWVWRAIAPHSAPISTEPWDASVHDKRLKSRLAMEIASMAYAWIGSMDVATMSGVKSDMKFLHHEISENGIPGAANIKACQAAIGNLNGAQRPDIPNEDRKVVWDHLASHLRDAGIEPIPLQEESAQVTAAMIDQTFAVRGLRI